MQQEQTWLQERVGEDDHAANTTYNYFMRPEPRQNMSPIRLEYDDYFQRKVKVREAEIGMTRNAPEHKRKTVKVFLEPFPHTRIDNAKPLQGWYKSKEEKPGVRKRPCFSEAILTEPYGGYCSVGCAFCYVNSGFRGYRGTGLITVPLQYGEAIARQLRSVRTGAPGYFSSFTDPFLELEAIYHNTRHAAQAFVDVGLPIFFLSRLRYPTWAINLMRKNKHSYAQKSINTPSPRDWDLLSPGAIGLEEHLADIKRLKKFDIYVSIQVNPVIAGVTTHDQVEELFQKLADVGTDHVIVKFVEAGYSWAPAMVERIRKRFGEERGNAFAELFQENIGGQRTINEKYRLEGHERYVKKATQLGMTYATCYEYKYKRDYSEDPQGRIVDKTGVSIGREYTTADQCHGQRVPVYERQSAEEQFKALDVCPPSGCLYCADENGGEPRCGSEELGSAKARIYSDLKHSLPIL